MQTVDHLIGMFDVDDVVEMVKLLHIRFKDIIDQAQRIYGLKIPIMVSLVQLAYIGFGCIEEHPLHERIGPVHLHLYEKLAATVILATHIDDGVLLQRSVGYKFSRKKLRTLYLLPFFEREQGIEEAGRKVDMLSEDFLERQIGAWIQIF